jgi:hypothetical protein
LVFRKLERRAPRFRGRDQANDSGRQSASEVPRERRRSWCVSGNLKRNYKKPKAILTAISANMFIVASKRTAAFFSGVNAGRKSLLGRDLLKELAEVFTFGSGQQAHNDSMCSPPMRPISPSIPGLYGSDAVHIVGDHRYVRRSTSRRSSSASSIATKRLGWMPSLVDKSC